MEPFDGLTREQIESAIFDELAKREPPTTETKRTRLRQLAAESAQDVIVAQSLVTARRDAKAMWEPCGGDIDLFWLPLGRSVRDDV